MKVLLTGGAGYLGTTLVRALIDAQHTLVVLDRFDWGTQPLLSAVGKQPHKVTVIKGDIRDRRSVVQAQRGCDALIHLAGIVGYPACDAAGAEADAINVGGTKLLCEFAERRPFLFASTGSTYGKVEELALETTPISPLTRYGRNKAEGEKLVQDAGGVSLRLATLFGPSHRMRWDLLPHGFAREAVTTGKLQVYQPEAARTFLHVQEAAQVFCEALAVGLPPGEVYNVGRGSGNWTKGAVAKLVQEHTQCRIEEIPGEDPDQRDYRVGYGKIREALVGWGVVQRPGFGLEQTMGEIVKWAGCWR